MSTKSMDFIETGQMPMQAATGSHDSLLLDRREARTASPPVVATIIDRPERASNLAARTDRTAVAEVPMTPAGGFDPALRSPGLALLATVCLLEGYKWIGALPASDSRLSTLVFSRAGALVFAALVTALALALTRTGGTRRRYRSPTVVVLASVAAVSASVALTVATGTASKDAVGLSDLVLAVALAGALIAAERRRRSLGDRIRPAQVGSDVTTLPFPSSTSRPDPGVAA
jgi:hypothetical protein